MGLKISVMLVASLLLSGCSHYYYVANIQNVPLLSEKNESNLSGAFAFGDESKSIEFQGSYAVTGKIGLMADLMTAWGGDYSDRDTACGLVKNKYGSTEGILKETHPSPLPGGEPVEAWIISLK